MIISAVGGVANAAIMYGDYSDIPPGVLTYEDVIESSGTDPVPLYGEPSISGNVLDFDPLGFVAVTNRRFDVTDGQLNFTVSTEPGVGMTSLFFSEAGDFRFFGAGGVPTSVSASLGVRVEILEVDNVALPSPIVVFATDTFITDMATEGGPTGLLDWSLGALADFGPLLPQGYNLGVTLAEVVVDNNLIATRQQNSVAFIAKKDFKVVPGGDLIVIPEPATAAMLMLAAVLGLSRRQG